MSARPRRVLIVEDNADGGETLKVFLELMGHDVARARTGPDGLAAARLCPPDVVVCDLGLPGLNGFEVARAIRADKSLAGVRLICVSGYATGEDRRLAREAGFDHVFSKPADPDAIASVIAAG